MFKVVGKYYHTLKYLKWIQIKYRVLKIWKDWKNATPILDTFHADLSVVENLTLEPSIPSHTTYQGDNVFKFLNIKEYFSTSVNWNFDGHGKLWTYNINYFEFLLQADMARDQGLILIHDFISKIGISRDGLEPFPISLRSMVWIKFIIAEDIKDDSINQSLYNQLCLLSKNVEYHLMGNHVLENGFSLLFGACYFNDKHLATQAEDLLKTQLKEQILNDGAHFELSPMYHRILLFRILDSINLLQNNTTPFDLSLLTLLQEKAAIMLGWMEQVTFSNGSLPNVNDNASDIGPSAMNLFAYAQRLNCNIIKKPLSDSGYRLIRKNKYEVFVDIGQIGPDYIPGHAHSDTLNFIVHFRGQPFIVDTGTSTYEKNAQRKLERGTASHNTVCVAGKEQTEIWGGFRVARRANIIETIISENRIQASHDGYRNLGTIHQRTFDFSDNVFTISDNLNTKKSAKALLHFHPERTIELVDDKLIGDFGEIHFLGAKKINLVYYNYARGFNHTEKAMKVIVDFETALTTKIQLV